jgi:type II secretory pathway component PulF
MADSSQVIRCQRMQPIWIWMQAAIVVCVVVAMVIAIVKLS